MVPDSNTTSRYRIGIPLRRSSEDILNVSKVKSTQLDLVLHIVCPYDYHQIINPQFPTLFAREIIFITSALA